MSAAWRRASAAAGSTQGSLAGGERGQQQRELHQLLGWKVGSTAERAAMAGACRLWSTQHAFLPHPSSQKPQGPAHL